LSLFSKLNEELGDILCNSCVRNGKIGGKDNMGDSEFSRPDDATLLKAKVRIVISRLFKAHLRSFERFYNDHDDAMQKLANALPDEYVDFVNLADYITDSRKEDNRREVLDSGNNAIREIEEMIDNLKI